MNDETFLNDLNAEMNQMKSDEDSNFCTQKISKLYKTIREFIETLPEKRKPKNSQALSENFYLGENEFIVKNIKISLNSGKIAISNLKTHKECPDLLEEMTKLIEKSVQEYCSRQKRELEEEQRKLIKEIEEF